MCSSDLRNALHPSEIAGSKIFLDAAWKPCTDPAHEKHIRTGIGIHCQIQEVHCKASLNIQATIPLTPSVLQAEAEALLLAGKIANLLQVRHVVFLTDNSTLAKAAATSMLNSPQVPWEIREHIAQFQSISQILSKEVHHIRRDLNKDAHRCAHQARAQYSSLPIFSCSNSSHRNVPCPIASAIMSLISQGYVITDVTCL